MASNESEYIEKTINQLGAIIKKPPLNEKYLSKPPFRFLHDVIMGVVKQTGFLEGLYEGEELDGKVLNESKEKKIAFLQKAIDAVQMTTGQQLGVKPSKIVAGQEPDRTNEFLQALAQAAKKGNDSDMVARVLRGEKPNFSASGDSGGSAGSNKENRDRNESAKEKPKDAKSASKERSSSKDRKEEKPEKSKSVGDAKSKEKSDRKERSESKEKSEKKKDDAKDKSGKADSKAKGGKEKSDSKSEKEKSSKDQDKARSASKTRDDDKKKESEKKSSSKSATTRRSSIDQSEDGDRKHRSSKSAKEEKKSDSKSDEKSKKRQSSAAAKLNDEIGGKEELGGKKRSSSSKREKDGKLDTDNVGLRIDLSSADRRDGGEIVELDHDETMNGEENRTEDRSNDKSSASATKSGGQIIRSSVARPSSAAGVRPGTASGARPGTAARAAPPRLKRQELGPSIAVDSVTTNAVELAPVVIQNDSKKSSDQNADEDDDFIVENREIDNLILNNDESNNLNGDLDDESGEHGQLVRKILETKKELESQLKTTPNERTVVVFDAQEREKTKKETGKLQEYVQQLTRTSHPLAKIIDFLQEDIDSMLKEFEFWRQEAKKDSDLLRQEKTTNGNGLDTGMLKNKLNELDQQIIEQSEAITAIRGVILNNEQRIHKLMSTISKK